MALSSENIGRHEFLTDEEVLSEKSLLEKPATIKKIEYLPLSSEMKLKAN